ncbi:MAG: hypothetical protein ABH860_01470 [bacterium]
MKSAFNIRDRFFGSTIAKAREAIKENKEIIKQVDKRLDNDNLSEADRAALIEVKRNSKTEIRELITAIKTTTVWSVRVVLVLKFASLKDQATDDDKAEFADATMESNKAAVRASTLEELINSQKDIAAESEGLKEIIQSIENEALRVSLLATFNAHNLVLAKMIADKILPPENATEVDYAGASQFIKGIFGLPIFTITSELTQKILDKITENNEMNRRADDLAYQKQLKEKKYQSIQDLKVALRKSVEKLTLLKNYENKLSEVPDDDKIKILSQILSQIQKPNPLVLS